MSKSSHTPGPWTVGSNSSTTAYVIAPRNLLTPSFTFGNGDELDTLAACRGDSEVRKANARLIAAAPDLLAVVRHVAEMGHDLRCDWYGGNVCTCGCERAQAAIAKAEGRAS